MGFDSGFKVLTCWRPDLKISADPD